MLMGGMILNRLTYQIDFTNTGIGTMAHTTIQQTNKWLKTELVIGYLAFGCLGVICPLIGAGAYQHFGLPNAPLGAAAGLFAVALATYAWKITWRVRRWWNHD